MVEKKKKEKMTSIMCSICDGTGYDTHFGNGKENTVIVEDCTNCNGKGYLPFRVIDKRVVSKKEKLILPDEF